MDFLRQVAADLHALRAEAKRKYPVVKEAVDRALESLPALQQQYAAILRVEGRAPGPGHRVFQSESVLRPFLLTCNHTNASHKILLLALSSIQRLVSWDAIESASVGSILRVLQIQAEKTGHADVQVKLLQTLLQLMTLAYEEKPDKGSMERLTTTETVANELVGNEELVLQAIWICLHLHAASGSTSFVVANTAAMTIRQLVSLVFDKTDASREAKHVGVLLFQELCCLSREENGMWFKRSVVSPMTAALGVELLETVLAAHAGLFRLDIEYKAVLKQQLLPLVQTVLERGCTDEHGGSTTSGITGPTTSSLTSNNTTSNSNAIPFFPLLVRGMRLASTVLCHFADAFELESALILRILLEIIATGTYTTSDASKPVGLPLKSPSESKFKAAQAIANLKEATNFLTHASLPSTSNSSTGTSQGTVTLVTWPVFLALEVLTRLCLEPPMVAAMVQYRDSSVLVALIRTTSSVILTSPPVDFKPPGTETPFPAFRSMLELLNEHETPALQSFYAAIRVATSCQCNLVASVLELVRSIEDESVCETLASTCVAVVAPAVLQSMNCVLRYAREVDLVSMALKSYHVLATVASRLRSTMSSAETGKKQMEDVVLTCIRALSGFSFPLPDGIQGKTTGLEHLNDSGTDESESCVVTIGWRQVQAMKALLNAAHVMANELTVNEWNLLLQGFEIIVDLTDSTRKQGQAQLVTKRYRIRAFEMQNEDIDQQLVMLSRSIDALVVQEVQQLEKEALERLVAAVCHVAWEVLGLERHETTTNEEEEDEKARVAHPLRLYWTFLGVGLTSSRSSGTFRPCFVLRTLTQLGENCGAYLDLVVRELVAMSTYEPVNPSLGPVLIPFQTFTTEKLLSLMQVALQRREKDEKGAHNELFKPLVELSRSRMRDQTLTGLLELLHSSGHLLGDSWMLAIFTAIQEACGRGESKTQGLAFKCLRLLVDELLVAMSSTCLTACMDCIGVFGRGASDVNIRLTAVNELWSVADLVGRQRKEERGHWKALFKAFSALAVNDRVEVRTSALNSLFGTAVTYGQQFREEEWLVFLDDTVLPLATSLSEATNQWTESLVVMFAGLSRVLATNRHVLRRQVTWFPSIATAILATVKQNTALGVPKVVVLAAIETLQTVLQVASASEWEPVAPVRVGVGMRVIGGTLVASCSSSVAGGERREVRNNRSMRTGDWELWKQAFTQLLALCDARGTSSKDEEEQEIASAVVAVCVALYLHAKDAEFHDNVDDVDAMVELFAHLYDRHVWGQSSKNLNFGSTSLASRVLNAFEACEGFASHPALHSKLVTQGVTYVQQAGRSSTGVFLTRHALTSLGKVYAQVSTQAQATTFDVVLGCLAPFLTRKEWTTETTVSTAEKAATHLWQHATRVLLVLMSRGLVAVKGDESCWRPLLAILTQFLAPQEGTFPSCVRSEEDQALVLSVVSTWTTAVVQILETDLPTICHDVLTFLGAGIDAKVYEKDLMTCFVSQLVTLCRQQVNEDVQTCARTRFVASCTMALRRYAEREEDEADALQVSEEQDEVAERVKLLLTSALEVEMDAQQVVTLYPALCDCIDTSNRAVRQLVQRVLQQNRLVEHYRELLRR